MGDGGGLDAAADAELGEDVGDVHAGRLGADEQFPGDLRVGAPGRDECEDLALTVGEAEARQLIGRPGRRRLLDGAPSSRLFPRVLFGAGLAVRWQCQPGTAGECTGLGGDRLGAQRRASA